MTSYFQYQDNKTRRTSSTNTGYEIVDIPDIMVTEDRQEHSSSATNDRHGWHCTCVNCRSDRGEDE